MKISSRKVSAGNQKEEKHRRPIILRSRSPRIRSNLESFPAVGAAFTEVQIQIKLSAGCSQSRLRRIFNLIRLQDRQHNPGQNKQKLRFALAQAKHDFNQIYFRFRLLNNVQLLACDPN